MNIILILLTGVFTSIMVFFNGSLEGYIGNFTSLIFIHTTGFVILSASFLKKAKPTFTEKKSKIYLLAGIIGILVVSINNVIYRKGGVLLALGGSLAGQVISATVMELYRDRKANLKMPLGKILSICLVVPGAILIGLRSNLPFYWILISWIPGMLILIQSWMNSQNILAYGFRKTTFIHYASPLAVLLIASIFVPVGDQVKMVLNGDVPAIFVVGGGAVSIFIVILSSYLLLKLKPITYVLLMYTGQLSSAIILDYTQGLPLSGEKLIAMCLIIGGLILGEVKIKRVKNAT